ncbi:MAG TPA: CheR family methyltransferase [Stellaceae bacterium]|nr:CheR family methyltransferase [Stellaceae bacterium]
MRGDSRELEQLAKDFLIHVTSFFRDPGAFEGLARTVIPDLVQHAEDRPIRVWVPGCSTGEEAFSLAMLFLEEFAAAKRAVKLQIFASDIGADALDFGRNGVYPDSIKADVSAERLQRFFTHQDQGYRVSRDLRDVIVFTDHDLLADPPFSRLDLISCRNLLIYLQPEEQQKVLSLFHFALSDGGYLFLGASETIGQLTGFFQPISNTLRIFRRIGHGRPRHRISSPDIGERARAL